MTPRLAVLHVGKFYPPCPGGMERVVQMLCEGVDPSIESSVLVANTGVSSTRDELNGIQVTRVGSFARIGTVAVTPTFPLELSRASRDLTVIHEPNPVALVSDWLTAAKGPLVVWFHSEVFRPQWKYRLLYRPFLRRVLQRADRIVVSSPPLAEHSAELHDFRAKCVVIPFGIDTNRLRRTDAVAEKVAAIQREIPGRRALFVGRLVPYKGVDVLIQAMASVDATALVVGDGPLSGALRQEADRRGVADKVRFLGSLSDEDVVAHLHACDVFTLPSVTNAETFGVAQLEAMACGKPVISTALRTGVPWVNRHDETGLVVQPADPAALAGALNSLLAAPDLRERMGAAGVHRVQTEFTLDAMNSRTAALYRTVMLERATEVAQAPAGHASTAANIID